MHVTLASIIEYNMSLQISNIHQIIIRNKIQLRKQTEFNNVEHTFATAGYSKGVIVHPMFYIFIPQVIKLY